MDFNWTCQFGSLGNTTKAFLTFLFLRDRVLHAKFCIRVVQLPEKSKAMWLVRFLDWCLIYWLIPMCCSQTYSLYDSPLNTLLTPDHTHGQGWVQKLWNKVRFARPSCLCNEVRNHDTFLSSLILHFLARKCGNPPMAYGTIATTMTELMFSFGLRIIAPKDDQTPCVPGEIFPVHQTGIF